MAFDAATGKKVWEIPHGRRFGNDQGRRPARHAHRGRRSSLHLRRERRPVGRRSGDRQGVLEDEPAREVRRVEHPMGPQRIAARAERSHSGRPGGRGAVDRGAEQDGRLRDLEEPGRRAGLFVRGAARGGRRPRGDLLHRRARARRRRRQTGKLLWSYDQVANQTANIATPIVARQLRVPLVGVRHRRRAARADAGTIGMAARQVYFTRDMRNHHATSVLIGDYLYGFSDAILTAMKFDTGQVAWRDRSVGKGSVVFADDRLYLYSETGRRRAGRGQSRRVPRARPVSDPSRAASPTWSHPIVSERQALHPRPGQHLRVRRAAEITSVSQAV